MDITGLNGGGAPWWVKALATVGVPSTIALYLVWSMVNGVTLGITAHATAAERSSNIMVNMLIQNCINGSDTRDEEEACFQVGRGGDPRRTR